MMGGTMDEWVRVFVAALLSVMVTSTAWYVGVAESMTTREEVIQIVSTQGPYLEDRKHLIELVRSMQATSEWNRRAIVDLRVEIAALTVTIKELERALAR